MNFVYRLIVISFICFSCSYATVDDTIAENQALYDELSPEVDNLTTVFGITRQNKASSLFDTIQTAITTVSGLTPEYPEQLGTLITLVENFTTLLHRAHDHEFLGRLHKNIAQRLQLLTTISTSMSASDIEELVQEAKTNLEDDITEMTNAHNLGAGDANGVYEESSLTELGNEIIRANDAYSITLGLLIFCTDYADFQGAQAAVPAPTDPDIIDYDTSFLDAQDAIEDSAADVLADLTAIASDIELLASIETLEDTQLDYIADAGLNIQEKLTQIQTFITAALASIAVARQDIALRVLQRQLLFDATTSTAKALVKQSIIAALATNTTAKQEFETTISATTALINISPAQFPSTPEVPADEGERSNMGVIVDEQVDAYFTNLVATLRQLFPSPPSQDTLDAIRATLSPAVYIQNTGSTMADWLTERENLLQELNEEEFAAQLGGVRQEWNELIDVLDAAAEDALITNEARTALTNAKTLDAFATLCEEETTFEAFSAKANTLLKRPTGSIRKISTIGNSQFQRLIISLIGQIQSGSVTKPATTLTNASRSSTSVKTVPPSPTATISDTNTLTVALDNGSEIVVTGTGDLPTRLRDPVFSDLVSNKLTASLKIFLNNSARVGLGTANITTTPGQTPNVLGGSDAESEDSIQIAPDGNGFIDVNSDLVISGNKPIVPTAVFGTAIHKLTFYSEVARTITITSNTTWDLTDFGSTGSEYLEYGKQIVFAGKVNLVLEPGAKIRFPHVNPADIKKTVVIVFKDAAQLICQGDQLIIGKPWKDLLIAGSDCKRNKFLGMGEIWFTGRSAMIINQPALASIEADFKTPKTDITFSLQNNAQLLIGTTDTPGGALQIGNMFDGGSKENPHSNEPDLNFPNTGANTTPNFVPNFTTIDFTLRIAGDQPLVKIGKKGFLGFAAGVINKDGAPNSSNGGPNGVTGITHSAWQLQHLYNVSNITLDVTQGVFDHSIIASGDNGDCSLFAISKLGSPFPYSKYLMRLGVNGKSIIKSGGMLYFVDVDASMVLDESGSVIPSPHTVNMNDAAYDISFIVSNSGKQAPLAPGFSIKTRRESLPGITEFALFGRATIQSTNELPYVFAGPSEEFFHALKLNSYNTTTNRWVPVSWVGTTPTTTYINGNTIGRDTVSNSALSDGLLDDAIRLYGYMRGKNRTGGRPTKFSMPLE